MKWQAKHRREGSMTWRQVQICRGQCHGSLVRHLRTSPRLLAACQQNRFVAHFWLQLAQVDVVLNHMAGPFVFSPEKDRGKAGLFRGVATL